MRTTAVIHQEVWKTRHFPSKEEHRVHSSSAKIFGNLFDLLGPMLNEFHTGARLGPHDLVQASGVLVCVSFGQIALPILRLLLTLGADPDSSPPDWPYLRPVNVASRRFTGITPLHVATACSSRRMCEFLLKRGADVNITDVAGKSALEKADEAELDSVAEILRAFLPAFNLGCSGSRK
ncbi:hypothetical protein FOL47_008668 [Perkinsus chesapeaki]|uniref:Uncharacterized protein n=1 Tax=Perkinsus chesapeaki TaxID=330153 RepID=A0A7J6LCH0_PERCH|nr:hypothetical protein FOL47_008668 [Perkinsus chesapeaki]